MCRGEDRQTRKRKSSNQKHTEINTSTDKQNKKLQITITTETNAFNSLIMFGVSPSNYANNNGHSFLALPRLLHSIHVKLWPLRTTANVYSIKHCKMDSGHPSEWTTSGLKEQPHGNPIWSTTRSERWLKLCYNFISRYPTSSTTSRGSYANGNLPLLFVECILFAPRRCISP